MIKNTGVNKKIPRGYIQLSVEWATTTYCGLIKGKMMQNRINIVKKWLYGIALCYVLGIITAGLYLTSLHLHKKALGIYQIEQEIIQIKDEIDDIMKEK